ncbi:MAG: dipeptide epimerase [Bacteroidia bacterium]|nr:dipeptide epimerase [Bacteroidia bacterium]
MKITRIEVIRDGLDLLRPYTIAYKTTSAIDVCLVKVHTDTKHIGLGSANPSPYVVGEDMDACIAALSPENTERFIGRDIRDLQMMLHELHEIYPKNPGAKVALDLAFYDLMGKYLDIPVVKMLGQHIDGLATSITIGIKNVEDTVEEAQEYYDRGFKILKVKLGHSLEEDLERLRKLRETFGNKMGIRVDANQGYTLEDLKVFHAKTQDMDLELVEQATPADDLALMQSLPEEIKKTIAADESLVDAKDAWKLVTPPGACGIFNIKLMKCGGIHQALRIAEVARLSGRDLMWGCNDESIVSIAGALHVAFSCEHTKYIDLDGSLDLSRDFVRGGFSLEEGVMRPTDAPGLGCTLLD